MGYIYIKSKMDLNKIIESTIRQFLNEDQLKMYYEDNF